MKKYVKLLASLIFYASFFYGCAPKIVIKEKPIETVNQKIDRFSSDFDGGKLDFPIPSGSKVDTVIVDSLGKFITINLSKEFSYYPYREENVKDIYAAVKNYFGKSFYDYKFSIRTLKHTIQELIPNFYRRDTSEYDYKRLPVVKNERAIPIIDNINKKYKPLSGLDGRNLVVWPSHGWYYNEKVERWEWQRPRLFQSVEDLLPYSFVIPYLIPMLEDAGANVFVPRERDIQKHEVVVDNDMYQGKKSKNYIEKSFDKKNKWLTGRGTAFAYGNPPYPNEYNPFMHGTYRIIKSDSLVSAEVNWIPDIPEEGYYAVYISYSSSDSNASDALYTIYHEGGKTEFRINQKIGGSTWEYLGKFKFSKGYHPDEDKVVLTNKSSEPDKIISADAVRFGGGMGVVVRNGSTSGRPKFVEGSRYYLQYLGMPDTLVYSLNRDTSDYKDDYQSRGEYANYLHGAPYGPNKDRNIKGLGIPIDLTVAFHTDAGIKHSDTTVGTLSIYSIEGTDSLFVYPDSVSRLANRDFADIMQTQIVNDIRAKYDPAWNRRQLREAQYSEAARPNIPSVLLELLSHQNFLDMQFALDPRFRFTVARAMYKAMLKFLSVQNRTGYIVQPLPVTHFSTQLSKDGSVILKWEPQDDPLEPSAKAEKYIVYTRINNGGFDNGLLVDKPLTVVDNLVAGEIYSFKVTAVNDGGESFPSEILSVCRLENSKEPVLIVNGFNRVCGPEAVETPLFSGFLNNFDAGVPDKYDISLTGAQYDFSPSSSYKSNDAPGHGASHSNYETKIIAGNTFDFPYIHGQSIKAAGYSFASTSAAAIIDDQYSMKDYKLVDLILGEQKETHWQKALTDSIRGTEFKAFPEGLQKKITAYLHSGGNMFISGAYAGSDMFLKPTVDNNDIHFAVNVLKFKWDTDHASKTGEVKSVRNTFLNEDTKIKFNTELNSTIYQVEAPDAVKNVNGSEILLRYAENNFGAATGYKKNYGVIVCGFPFETILDKNERNQLMKAVFNYFEF